MTDWEGTGRCRCGRPRKLAKGTWACTGCGLWVRSCQCPPVKVSPELLASLEAERDRLTAQIEAAKRGEKPV